MNEKYDNSSVELEALHDEAFKWACSCCHYDEDDAKEVLQQVYLEIISNKAVFRGESTLRTWLFGVIRNVALRLQRTQNSAELLREKMKFLMGENECGDEVLQAQERNRLSHEVIQAISSLPTMQRQVVELVYYREFTLAESAEVLGIGIGSTRTHFHRAKQALSGLLQHTRN